jgi:hypothetical protein
MRENRYMRLNTALYFLLLLSLLFASSPDNKARQAPPQTKGSIVGIVIDPQGAVVPEATVTAVNKQTGRRVSTQTNDNGNFAVTGLDPGRYRVEVAVGGFKPVTVDNVAVTIGGSASLNITFVPITDSTAGKIKGEVKAKGSNAPIAGATISITQVSNEKAYPDTKTDSKGRYEKAGLPPDRYKVRAEATGFTPSEQTVKLKAREVKKVNFTLTPR